MKHTCKIAFFLALIGLAACSPQKRLARLVSRHPELVTADTLHISRDIPVPAKSAEITVATDTVIAALAANREIVATDTATGISVKIARHKPASGSETWPSISAATPSNSGIRTPSGDMLSIQVTVPSDTIHYREALPVQTVIVQPRTHRWWWVIAAVFAALVVWLVIDGRRKNE